MASNDLSGVRSERGIVFARGGDIDLKLEVHHPPAGTANGACVIEVYGGGFTRGNTGGHYPDVFKRFAPLGYVCVAPQYRLGHEGKFPAQIDDLKAGILWTVENAARLNVDPAKIVVAGYSAGAQLALLAAGHAEAGKHLAACIAYYPAFSRRGPGSPVHPIMTEASTDADYARTEPLNAIAAGYPPTIMFCGTHDGFMEHTQQLQAKIAGVGSEVEAHYLAGLDHIFDRDPALAGAATRWCHLFMDRYVVNPREMPAYQRPAPVTAN